MRLLFAFKYGKNTKIIKQQTSKWQTHLPYLQTLLVQSFIIDSPAIITVCTRFFRHHLG